MFCPYVVKFRLGVRWQVYGCYSTPSGVKAVLELLQAEGLSTFVERRGDAPPLSFSQVVS